MNLELPKLDSYEWGWGRFCLGGYSNNDNPEKDYDNLNRLIDAGWMPVIKSPHPSLKLNKHGYVTVGDLILMVRKVKDYSLEHHGNCIYLIRDEKKLLE